jgi:hypothetical protein
MIGFSQSLREKLRVPDATESTLAEESDGDMFVLLALLRRQAPRRYERPARQRQSRRRHILDPWLGEDIQQI